jgi:hypothetical protein
MVRSRPPVGWPVFEKFRSARQLPRMTFHRRRLPHLYEVDQPVFLTWRPHDSLPPHRTFPTDSLSSGKTFAALDRLLHETRDGAVYLRQPAIADMIVEAIHSNSDVLGHYLLHAFVVMPNHVQLLATPARWHCPN